MMDFTPEIVQVVPREDYTVDVYFADGKIVTYDVGPKLESGVFRALKDSDVFMNRCCIMNDTLAWDVAGNRDATQCIDLLWIIAMKRRYPLCTDPSFADRSARCCAWRLC
jgi:hypothetical protein